jgi:hypothetical protein
LNLLVVTASLLVACHPSIDVHGIYVGDDREGMFFPCDDPTTIVLVPDSTLAATYRQMVTQPHQPVYVHLRGVRGHAGSIYGGPKYFLVDQVVEIRARRTEECPKVARPVSPVFPTTAGPAAVPSEESVLSILDAYSHGLITADSAARVVLDYLQVSHSLNVELDAGLRNAVRRELRRRTGHN